MARRVDALPEVEELPQVTETRVHRGGGGKIAIVDYGKISSDYSANITRTYSIPPGWTDEQVAVFELEKLIELKEQIDPILQEEYDFRYDRREWSD